MEKIYIKATGNISAQKTFGHPVLLPEITEHPGSRMTCIEPDYKNLFDAKQIRRMSRIIRMATSAALECIHEAGINVPEAIITGTAYGCLGDTEVFLKRMVESEEQLNAPTAFIQSTHNTAGAQIAMMLKCRGYNNTFVHKCFSFESALQDAVMLLNEQAVNNVLVGGLDEITDTSYKILSRFGLYKSTIISNLHLFSDSSPGTVAGEGAAFFLLQQQASDADYAVLEKLTVLYKPLSLQILKEKIAAFLDSQNAGKADLDLIITGENGDPENDSVYTALKKSVFIDRRVIPYKNLSGDYPTSSSFSLWLAANILKTGKIPAVLSPGIKDIPAIRKILIFNNYKDTHYSLMLLSAC